MRLFDFRVAARSLLRSPRFVFSVTITLALGIGANTAIFSVADAMLLRRLPSQRETRLVHISEIEKATADGFAAVSPADLQLIVESTDLFSQVAAAVTLTATLVHRHGAEEIRASEVTPNFFEVMGLQPWLGRGFTAADTAPSGTKVLILSHELWQSRTGGDSGIVGRSLQLNDETYQVIGVMPPNSGALEGVDAWMPFALEADSSNRVMYLDAVGELRDGLSLQKAQAALDVISERLARDHPDSNAGFAVRLAPLRRHLVGTFWTPLAVLVGAGIFILLITCANVANLLLARGASRQAEVAIRKALGASNGDLMAYAMSEAILLALLGSLLALPFSVWLVDLLRAYGPPNVWQMKFVAVNWRVLAFAVGVGVWSVLLFAAAPAWWSARAPRAPFGATALVRRRFLGRTTLSSALVVSEVALSIPLLAGAVLMLNSLWRLDHVDIGLKRDKLVVGQVWLSRHRYPLPAQRRQFFVSLLDHLRDVSPLGAASLVSFSPLTATGAEKRSFVLEGSPDPVQKPEARFKVVDADYLRTLNVPLVDGRSFAQSDDEDTEHVAMVSRSFARQYMGNEGALDRRIRIDFPGRTDVARIVGVVEDVRSWPDTNVEPTLYVPFLQDPLPMMSILIRSDAPFDLVARAIREQVAAFDPQQAVREVSTMQTLMDERLGVQRFVALLLQMFGVLAALLAAVGTYGVISFLVTSRRRELAIRSALGATPGRLVGLFVGQSLRWGITGAILGVGGAAALTRLLQSLLYQISPEDPIALSAGALALVSICVLGAAIPALKASRVLPGEVLRAQ